MKISMKIIQIKIMKYYKKIQEVILMNMIMNKKKVNKK